MKIRHYYWECIKMFIRSIKPSSLAMTRISFVIAVLALLSWIITNRFSWSDISQAVSFWVFVVGIVSCACLAPYMVYQRDTEALKKEIVANQELYKKDTTKLPIISEQKINLNRYIYSRFSHLYLRNNQQIDIEIEWFNGTLFELSFDSAREGVIKIDGLQRKIGSNDKRQCQHSNFAPYTITVDDKEIVDLVRSAVLNSKLVKLVLVFTSDVNVTYYPEYETKDIKPTSVICSIDKLVIPEKV